MSPTRRGILIGPLQPRKAFPEVASRSLHVTKVCASLDCQQPGKEKLVSMDVQLELFLLGGQVSEFFCVKNALDEPIKLLPPFVDACNLQFVNGALGSF